MLFLFCFIVSVIVVKIDEDISLIGSVVTFSTTSCFGCDRWLVFWQCFRLFFDVSPGIAAIRHIFLAWRSSPGNVRSKCGVRDERETNMNFCVAPPATIVDIVSSVADDAFEFHFRERVGRRRTHRCLAVGRACTQRERPSPDVRGPAAVIDRELSRSTETFQLSTNNKNRKKHTSALLAGHGISGGRSWGEGRVWKMPIVMAAVSTGAHVAPCNNREPSLHRTPTHEGRARFHVTVGANWTPGSQPPRRRVRRWSLTRGCHVNLLSVMLYIKKTNCLPKRHLRTSLLLPTDPSVMLHPFLYILNYFHFSYVTPALLRREVT